MANILVDLTALYNRPLTGIERYGIEFYNALLETNHNIFPIFCKENTLDLNPNAIIINNSNRILVENLFLPWTIFRNKTDICFFPIFPPPFLSYRYNGNCKLVPTLHDLAFKHYKETLSYKARLYLTPKYNMALKKSYKIITISNTMKNEIIELSNCEVLNWGENISSDYILDNFNFNETILNKYGIKKDSYIISVSTLEPRKNIAYLLSIWNKIRYDFPNLKLVFVGRNGWGNNKEIQKMICEGGDSIIFTGFVSDSELINLYHYSKAFILLSKYEGFGRTPLEALACGTNIIVSDIPVFRENLNDNAVFIPLDSEVSALNIIKEILYSPKNTPCVNNEYFNLLNKNIKNQIDLIL